MTSTHDLFKKERNHEQEIPAKCINFVLELLYPRCWMLYSGPGSHQRGSGSSMGSGSNGNYRNFRSTRSWPSDRTAICRSSVRQTRTPHFHCNRKCFLCNLPDRPCSCISCRNTRRLHHRLRMRHHRRYRKLLPGYRYLPGSIRDYLQSSWRCYHGNQILHRNRSDAASICSWCSCYFYSSRPYLLQSVILRMRNRLYRTFCTGIPVPAARR